MRRQKPPGIFALEARDTSAEYFEARIENCESVDHLREAVTVEADGPARGDRIARINQGINEVQA